jgi:hypothetical protein
LVTNNKWNSFLFTNDLFTAKLRKVNIKFILLGVPNFGLRLNFCSKPFELDLDYASGGKWKNNCLDLLSVAYVLAPLISPEVSGFFYFLQKD